MNTNIFQSLNLKLGDLIYVVNEKGEGTNGTYENEYDSSNESFKFTNFSNGKTETLYLSVLQDLRKS